jgi:BA14K-like protein
MLKWILHPLAAALALLPVAAAALPPASRTPPAAAGAAVDPVQWRHHNGFGAGLGVGLGLGILGAIIADEAYGPRPGYSEDDYAAAGPPGAPAEDAGDPRTLCAQHFRSFEWNSGLYTSHSGEKRLCPYLR